MGNGLKRYISDFLNILIQNRHIFKKFQMKRIQGGLLQETAPKGNDSQFRRFVLLKETAPKGNDIFSHCKLFLKFVRTT